MAIDAAFQKTRLLLVEDDHVDSFYLRELLSGEWQYEIVQETTLAEARSSCVEEAFDAILLDLTLPDSSGLETLREMLKCGPRTAIIVLTGLNDEEIALQSVREGAQDYLMKQELSASLLKRSIRYAIERKAALIMREDVERIIRHDLRSPLSSLFSFCRLLKEESLSTEIKDYLPEAEATIQRLLGLINLTQDIYRIEMGTYEPLKNRIDIRELIEGVLRGFSLEASHRGIEFAISGPDKGSDTPPVLGEEILLFSLFQNLIKNALDTCGEGDTVELKISLPEGHRQVEIMLANPGTVPEFIENRFFEKYVSTKKNGLGLGTYTAKLIAELHNGSIELSTKKPNRVELFIHLPLGDGAWLDSQS